MKKAHFFAGLGSNGPGRNGPTGPPAGFTGPVAPGYLPAGDSRIRAYIDDADSAFVTYSPAGSWRSASNALYAYNTLHYIDNLIVGAKVNIATYWGGGFYVTSYTAGPYGIMDIYDNGVYVYSVDYTSAESGGQGAHRVKIRDSNVLLFDLPEGPHALEFRINTSNSKKVWVHDAIELAPAPGY